jgi:excisionase family DNA binding protein
VERSSQPPPVGHYNLKMNAGVQMEKKVPIWEKANLTIEEASDYFGIGVNKIREITDNPKCECVLWVGTKRLIKRRKFEKYLDDLFSI